MFLKTIYTNKKYYFMKYILIIGAKSDLAKNIADIYASEGYSLYLTGRNIKSLSEFSATLTDKYDIDVKLIELDLNQFNTHEKFLKQMETLPIGIICASGYYPNQLKAQNDKIEMSSSVVANFTGPVSIVNYIIDEMKKIKKGFVVGISSVSGERGRAKNYIYGSAKSGFTTFLSGLRNDVFDHNIHVMTVILGFIKDENETNLVKNILGARPREVAELIVRNQIKCKNIVYLKWYWKYIMFIVRNIPEFIFKRMHI